MDFTQKLAVMQLTLPSTRNELAFPGEWYLAENRRFLDLEFFNTIGRLPPVILLKIAPGEQPLTAQHRPLSSGCGV